MIQIILEVNNCVNPNQILSYFCEGVGGSDGVLSGGRKTLLNKRLVL